MRRILCVLSLMAIVGLANAAEEKKATADKAEKKVEQKQVPKKKVVKRKYVEIKPLPPAPNEVFFGARIQRTMTLLATSNEKIKRNVKILFYGQSIVQGMYWQDMIADLQKRYPHANIICENRAIGGFTAPSLVRPAVHDLYPFYPDLVVFHDYGAMTSEWERMIYNIRKYTTAEIMVYTHQVAHRANQEAATKTGDNTSDVIRYIAQKYNCELVEVRKEWKNYLKTHDIKINELMGDKVNPNVHPNKEGHTLLAQMVARHFRENTIFPGGWFNMVRTYEVRRPLEEKDDEIIFTGKPWMRKGVGLLGRSSESALKLKFTGNRVDVVSFPFKGKLGSAKILIDGKAPSTFPSLYYATRPSKAHKVWWPALKRVSLGGLPSAEKWTMTLTKVSDDAKDIEYELEGSVTGKDGKGTNKADFVSNSGKIIIARKDINIAYAQVYKKTKCPENFQITWEVKPAFVDVWKPVQLEDDALENRTTLFQGLENKEHTLEIIPDGNGSVPIKSIVVHTPPLK